VGFLLALFGILAISAILLVSLNLDSGSSQRSNEAWKTCWSGIGVSIGLSLGTSIGMLWGFAIGNVVAGLLRGPTMGTGSGMILGAGLDARFGRAGHVSGIENISKAGVTVLCAAGMVALLLYLLAAFSGLAPIR